jgi:ABC-type nitrate/sulfonate/bicarbonate transport system permease component
MLSPLTQLWFTRSLSPEDYVWMQLDVTLESLAASLGSLLAGTLLAALLALLLALAIWSLVRLMIGIEAPRAAPWQTRPSAQQGKARLAPVLER